MEVKEMVRKGQNINAQVYKGQVIVIPGGGGGEISPEAIKEAVDEYLEANPPAQGTPGKDGQDGYTPVKFVDYFTPSEVEEIAAQAAGMVEVPEGGDGAWKLLSDETVTEDVTEYKRSFEPVYRIAVCFYTPGGTAGTVNAYINSSPESYVIASINKTFSTVSSMYMIRPPKTLMAEHPKSNGALLVTSITQSSSGVYATSCNRDITSLVLNNGTVYAGTRIVIYGEEW